MAEVQRSISDSSGFGEIMGLGLLFIGYLLVSVFTLAPSYFLTDLIGSYIMIEALNKLRPHAERFRYAIATCYLLFTVMAVQCGYYALLYVGIIDSISILEYVIEISRLGAMFFYTVAMLLALSELSSSVGDEKLAYKCRRNMWFFCVYYFFVISLSLDFDFLEAYISAFSAFAFLLKFVCAILICANIYSCYMWICLEGDHDMEKEKKPSKIKDFFAKVRSGGKDDVTKEDIKRLSSKNNCPKGNDK